MKRILLIAALLAAIATGLDAQLAPAGGLETVGNSLAGMPVFDFRYCKLSGCTMTGALTASTSGVVFNGSALLATAANIIEQRNAANAQSYKVYNTWTDGSNGEWVELSWASNLAQLLVTKNGSGSARSFNFGTAVSSNVNFVANNTAWWTLKAGGNLVGVTATTGVLTAGTMTQTNTAEIRSFIHRYDWTNAMVVALGAGTAGDIAVATLPAKTVVKNVYVVITGAAGTVTTLTVAVGRVSAAYIDYIVASDAKAAANTVYGDASGERGTNLVGYDLPSFTGTTVVNAHFVSTGSNLNTVTTSTGSVYIETVLLP